MTTTIKLHLTRVRLNSQGYDSNGRYYGVDKPLWHYCDGDYNLSGAVRADTRDLAKEVVKKQVKEFHRVQDQVKFFR